MLKSKAFVRLHQMTGIESMCSESRESTPSFFLKNIIQQLLGFEKLLLLISSLESLER